MSRSRPPSRLRVALAAATLVCIPVTGCALPVGDTSKSPDTKRVSAAGVSFEVPEEWEELDAEDVAKESGESSEMAELAEGMGVTPAQLEQTISSVDLLLVSDEGPDDGFVDNLNVVQIPAQLPNDDKLLKVQLRQMGVDVQTLSHERTELGDATVAVVELDMAGRTVQGELLVVDVDGWTVCVTVGASDRETTEEVADRVLDTLAKAS